LGTEFYVGRSVMVLMWFKSGFRVWLSCPLTSGKCSFAELASGYGLLSSLDDRAALGSSFPANKPGARGQAYIRRDHD